MILKKLIFLVSLFLLQISLPAQIKTGAECTEDYTSFLKNKRVGVVANHTSFIKKTHLVDSLLSLKIQVVKIFSPEHGFRGNADAGEHVSSNIDKKTGLPLISLYADNKKPTPEQMKGIDVMVYDLQDVGVRFYTYISTMHNIMEACAQAGIECVILDRPNPNGFYIDGNVLDMKYTSFIGMHPVPIVHGMTVAEYAQMINGEKWLANGIQCKLKLITCDKYTHAMKYTLPITPSPNLPNMQAVYLYPALCLTEGTPLSCGRGTQFPFQVIGHPSYKKKSFSFTPVSIVGASKNPPLKNQLCYGMDLRKYNTDTITQIPLELFIEAYNNYQGAEPFFTPFFTKLAGNELLAKQISQKISIEDIRKSWEPKLTEFKKTRKKYLLYKDF